MIGPISAGAYIGAGGDLDGAGLLQRGQQGLQRALPGAALIDRQDPGKGIQRVGETPRPPPRPRLSG